MAVKCVSPYQTLALAELFRAGCDVSEGVADFEYTQKTTVFDMHDIRNECLSATARWQSPLCLHRLDKALIIPGLSRRKTAAMIL